MTSSCLQCAAGVECTPTAPVTLELLSDCLSDPFGDCYVLRGEGLPIVPLNTQAFGAHSGVLDPQLLVLWRTFGGWETPCTFISPSPEP